MARKEARMHRAPGRTRSEKTVMKTGIQGVGKRTDERRTRTARCCRARGWHKSDGEIAAAIFPLSIPNFRYLSLIFSIRSLLSSSHSVPRSSSAFSRAFHSPRSYQTVCTLRFLHLIRAIFSLPAHFSDTIFAIFFSLPLSLSLSLPWSFFPIFVGGFSRKTRLILLTLLARVFNGATRSSVRRLPRKRKRIVRTMGYLDYRRKTSFPREPYVPLIMPTLHKTW